MQSKNPLKKAQALTIGVIVGLGLLLGSQRDVQAAKQAVKASLGQTLQARKKRFLPCYNRALKAAPGLTGRLVMRFQITAGGKVTGAKIARSNLAHTKLHNCIVKELSGWSFAKRSKALSISYPLHLTPGPPPKRNAKLGRLKKAQIQSVVRANMGKIKRCYEVALQASPRLRGKIVVEFVISQKGQVARANIKKNGLGQKQVKVCILAQVRQWLFPKPRGGGIVKVSYPFVFRP